MVDNLYLLGIVAVIDGRQNREQVAAELELTPDAVDRAARVLQDQRPDLVERARNVNRQVEEIAERNRERQSALDAGIDDPAPLSPTGAGPAGAGPVGAGMDAAVDDLLESAAELSESRRRARQSDPASPAGDAGAPVPPAPPSEPSEPVDRILADADDDVLTTQPAQAEAARIQIGEGRTLDEALEGATSAPLAELLQTPGAAALLQPAPRGGGGQRRRRRRRRDAERGGV